MAFPLSVWLVAMHTAVAGKVAYMDMLLMPIAVFPEVPRSTVLCEPFLK
jgi:hypothetical protein